MKFGKLLQQHADASASAERKAMFLDYKKLKKVLKDLAGKGAGPPAAAGGEGGAGNLSEEEVQFIATLNEEVKKFNEFFVDKEEEYVIQVRDLEDRMKAPGGDGAGAVEVQRALVELHGELVLQLHWSSLNYTSLIKILKKHDKISDISLRSPFLKTVLSQPFYSTSILHKMVKQVEGLLGELVQAAGDSGEEDHLEALKDEDMEEYSLLKETRSALKIWESLSGATYTTSPKEAPGPPAPPPAKRARVDG